MKIFRIKNQFGSNFYKKHNIKMKGELVYKLQLYYKDEYIRLFQGDCLEVMDRLIEKGVKFDAIITDPPYGTTACKWDSIIPFDKMWERLNRLIKEDSAIVLFGSEPFSSALRMSNIKNYKYDWIWDKNKASNYINCKYQPMKTYEDICVFSKMSSTYSVKGNMKYFPQGIIMLDKPKIQKRTSKKSGEIYHTSPNIQTQQIISNYPNSILNFKFVSKPIHPTQKPVSLMEYLINTYTNENDLILDFTCGSGTTLLAARNLKRKCIGIELEEKYCEIAKNRLTA